VFRTIPQAIQRARIYDLDMRWVIAAALAVGFLPSAEAERMKSPTGEIKDVPAESVEFARREGWSSVPVVLFRRPDGDVIQVYEDDQAYALNMGYWKMTDAEVSAFWSKRAQRDVAEVAAEVEAQKAADQRTLIYWAIGIALAGVAAWIVWQTINLRRAK